MAPKLSTQQIAAIKLDKNIHKASHESLLQLVQNITGDPTIEEFFTRDELIGEIRRLVTEAREELEWSNAETPDALENVPSGTVVATFTIPAEAYQ